ncbi:hypothetical protein ABT185_01730 [Streptomyces clavifer]|uniref:hypothetical protein n=1 Tax=Streptomyces clavifer TaxID=68188 RepID=UPI0033271FED
MHVRLYLVSGLGAKRLGKLTVRDVRTWVNRLLDDARTACRGRTPGAMRPAAVPLACTGGSPCRSFGTARSP